MWFIRIQLLLITFAFTGCAAKVVVEITTMPEKNTLAKIRQLKGDTQNTNPSHCNLPCSVKLEQGDRYEVSLNEPGYYPVVIQFDWLMAFKTSVFLEVDQINGHQRTPLVIPLLPSKAVATPLKNNIN